MIEGITAAASRLLSTSAKRTIYTLLRVTNTERKVRHLRDMLQVGSPNLHTTLLKAGSHSNMKRPQPGTRSSTTILQLGRRRRNLTRKRIYILSHNLTDIHSLRNHSLGRPCSLRLTTTTLHFPKSCTEGHQTWVVSPPLDLSLDPPRSLLLIPTVLN
jgi:hypothetical protein